MLMDSILMLIVFLFGVFLFKIPLSAVIILKSLPVIFLSLLAFLGFGFLFAGLVMLLKNIGPFAQLFEFGMLFFSGVFFPLTLMPNWVRSFAEFIPPLTHAISTVRTIFSGGGYSQASSSIGWLVILAPLYWLIGYLLFRWAERLTRVIGYGATELRALWGGVAVKSWKVFLSYKVWFISDIGMGFLFVGQALLIGLGLTGKRNSEALQRLTGYSDYVAFASSVCWFSALV